MNEYIIQNFEIYLKFLMFIIVIISSFLIYFRVNKLFNLSNYSGFRIFSKAFLYFGIAYTINLILKIFEIFVIDLYKYPILYLFFATIFFFSIIMAGLLLIYSLVWKELENSKFGIPILDKIFKNKYIILYLIGITITIISLFKFYFMFIIMLALFSYAIILSYLNYKRNRKQFSQLYFLAMVLGFFGYLANFLLGFFPIISIYVDLIIIIIFITFSYGVFKVVKK